MVKNKSVPFLTVIWATRTWRAGLIHRFSRLHDERNSWHFPGLNQLPHQSLTWIRHILFICAFYYIRDPPTTFTCDNKQCRTLDLKPSTSPLHISLCTLRPTIRSIPLRCCCLCACASALLVSQLCTEFLFIIFQRAFHKSISVTQETPRGGWLVSFS